MRILRILELLLIGTLGFLISCISVWSATHFFLGHFNKLHQPINEAMGLAGGILFILIAFRLYRIEKRIFQKVILLFHH